MDLELRQQRILAAIIKEYSETATPVGSKELVDKYKITVAPQVLIWGQEMFEDGVNITPSEFYTRLKKTTFGALAAWNSIWMDARLPGMGNR